MCVRESTYICIIYVYSACTCVCERGPHANMPMLDQDITYLSLPLSAFFFFSKRGLSLNRKLTFTG